MTFLTRYTKIRTLLNVDLTGFLFFESTFNRTNKRVTGIGPATQAWEAWILPLNYTRNAPISIA